MRTRRQIERMRATTPAWDHNLRSIRKRYANGRANYVTTNGGHARASLSRMCCRQRRSR